jgi:hypothetical protein
MILDLASKFSAAQALTATAISTNVIDLRNAATPLLVDEGMGGDEIWLVVQVITAAAGGDAAKTLTITLESDSTADLATSATVHYTSPAFTGAQLIAGFVAIRTPLPSSDYERYLGLRYTVSAGFTSFTIDAFLTPDVQRNVIYPKGYAIL